ncbi:two-component system, OmpR family, sensor histidine kinase BaeS [Sporosarcina newyorkensis]|uniref:histidine kinase n=2 Tax=Caryophanaceae TaxID=186818 RepID=A0A1T4Y996_9BACL|nr:two-component system, OmpR family, sensor histidine kinase BaeS [Sporosarcina newyorkensis]
MRMIKLVRTFLPKQLLWRLTFLNVFAISLFIILSSFAIYNTACVLVDGMGTMDEQRQNHFNATLLQYLWIFSISTILMGSLIHFYLTWKLIRPLEELIESTKDMKKGRYPDMIQTKSRGEIGELIIHFNELVQQLKNNQQSRQKLVTDLSHEFRTPLSNLTSYLIALRNGVIVGDRELFDALSGESKRLTTMVEQLEQLKEWDYVAKQTFTEKERVDMRLLIEQSIEMFHWTLEEKGIPVIVEADVGMVNVYNGGIPQVLSNIIDNAIRYYEGKEPIIIHGESTEEGYRVSISSEGQEITEAERTKVFERFYQGDAPRSHRTGGTGLGLAISKEIIEHHNGRVGLNSIKNHYHTFWFTIPLE